MGVMDLAARLMVAKGYLPSRIYSALPFHGVDRPVFIIGCGRSGTTIFGESLSKHSQITYLNECRHLWSSCYPETDIWTRMAHLHNGKLYFTAADAEHGKSKKLSRLFRFETVKSGKPILVEKLPINNFRLGFIQHIFPDARFIHIYRSGLEVARSIGVLTEQNRWFNANPYKWEKLVEYALSKDDTKDLPDLCVNPFDKGLLEWRLSTEAAVEFLKPLASDVYLEIKYDELVDWPVETLSRVIRFIGLGDDPEVFKFVSRSVRRKTSNMGRHFLSDKEVVLGGRLLPLSMDEEIGLAKR